MPANDRQLFVAGLPPSCDDTTLKSLFTSYGTIESAHIAKDGKGRTIGFVTFSTATEAKNALNNANGKTEHGIGPLSVAKALRPDEKKDGSSRKDAGVVGKLIAAGMSEDNINKAVMDPGSSGGGVINASVFDKAAKGKGRRKSGTPQEGALQQLLPSNEPLLQLPGQQQQAKKGGNVVGKLLAAGLNQNAISNAISQPPGKGDGKGQTKRKAQESPSHTAPTQTTPEIQKLMASYPQHVVPGGLSIGQSPARQPPAQPPLQQSPPPASRLQMAQLPQQQPNPLQMQLEAAMQRIAQLEAQVTNMTNLLQAVNPAQPMQAQQVQPFVSQPSVNAEDFARLCMMFQQMQPAASNPGVMGLGGMVQPNLNFMGSTAPQMGGNVPAAVPQQQQEMMQMMAQLGWSR